MFECSQMSQSCLLSQRLSNLALEGRHLNDDSCQSEGTLTSAMCDVISYARELFSQHGASIEQLKSISLYECQQHFHAAGGPVPDPLNKKVSMKPDGGILVAIKDDKMIPILIVEDKVQGTNDLLYASGKKRQATGNAIERGAKNIRGAEMLFGTVDIFPYVLLASGCDFHASETIAKRIEMMNMGFPNHYMEVCNQTNKDTQEKQLDNIISSIDIQKKCGKSIASVFIKAHKWNEMKHGSSRWQKEEIVKLCKKVLDQVYESISLSGY